MTPKEQVLVSAREAANQKYTAAVLKTYLCWQDYKTADREESAAYQELKSTTDALHAFSQAQQDISRLENFFACPTPRHAMSQVRKA